MLKGRLRNLSDAETDNGPRHRWTRRLDQQHLSSTPKENNGPTAIGALDSVDPNSPSSISNVSSSTGAAVNNYRYNRRTAGYAYETGYEAVYAEKVVVRTVENIITNDPTYAPLGFIRSRRRWWWPWILIPLLFLIPLGFLGASDKVRNTLCPLFGPLPVSTTPNKTLEIITLKKFYHYFVPSPQVSPHDSSADTDAVKNFETMLSAVDSRLGLLEDGFKRITVDDSGSKNKNYTKEIQELRILISNLDQKIAELESTSLRKMADRQVLNDELSTVKNQLFNLQSNLGKLENERKSWHDQLNDIVSRNRQHQLDLVDINSRLDSLARADCNCPPAILPEGGVNKQEVDRLIVEAIRRYDADKTGLPDYALEPAGGTVLSTRCTETYPSNTREQTIFGIPIPFWPKDYSPRTVIQPGLTPGECWAFKGARGYLVIKLSGLIQVTAVSYEHIPKEISPDGNIFSAPKDMEVFALESELDQNGTQLGTFTYNADGTPLQYFPVQAPNVTPTEYLELRVTSNHGHPLYTCLYRVRVHGKRLNAGWPSFGGDGS